MSVDGASKDWDGNVKRDLDGWLLWNRTVEYRARNCMASLRQLLASSSADWEGEMKCSDG